ncbi:integrase [Pandoraea horticolens]|uniref:Integrase n=1 Tax=Pandoraea horticolens TaxID=2508298 RepID=A0A5E4ZD35_9BURK|nr:site-specific integrase [Pandoraea horticolens]VVE58778.1 integrase [Pandoraea horticolens]
MATYRKRGTTWRAEVAKAGVRRSGTFNTKAEAVAWATSIEAKVISGSTEAVVSGKTLRDAFLRYATEVSPTKAGARWELVRFNALTRQLDFIGEILGRITSDQIGSWRDGRLAAVAPSTVNRDMNLLSAVFEAARREWKWCEKNPIRDVRRPRNPKPRDRRVAEKETQAMVAALGYVPGRTPETHSQRVALAFLIALETGMRQGEIAGLEWGRVFLNKRYVRLANTKNGDARDVPLSSNAVEYLELLPQNGGPCLGVNTPSIDALWRKARAKASRVVPTVADLRFHDSRHEAITRLARKLDVLDLARMIGHRDPRSLMIYYNATASDIAGRLG